jgi:hypothetical protein
MVYFDGYVYICSKKRKKGDVHDGWYMKCREDGCNASISVDLTFSNPVPSKRLDHITGKCFCDEIRKTNEHAKQQLKDFCKGEHVSDNFFNQFIISLRDPTLTGDRYVRSGGWASFPTKHELHSSLSRWKKGQFPNVPTLAALTDALIPPFLKTAYRTDPNTDPPLFMFHFSEVPMVQLDVPGNDIGKFMMFATPAFFRELAGEENIFVDGTFKVVPKIFHEFRSSSQVFTFHAFQGDRCIPYLYAVLPAKTRRTYAYMLRGILNYAAAFQPSAIGRFMWSTVMMDFEESLRQAFTEVFPQVQQRGCLFHFAQAIYRHIAQESILRYLYKETAHDYEFRTMIRKLEALAFLPPDKVREEFDVLESQYYQFHPRLCTHCPVIREVC